MPSKSIKKSQISTPFNAEFASAATSATLALTASLVATSERNAIISAATASGTFAVSATNAASAGVANTAQIANTVATAERNAIISDAISGSLAASGTYATSAGSATYATTASSANNATNATTAITAHNADSYGSIPIARYENGLRIVRGSIAADGSISAGAGFTAGPVATGIYDVGFTNAFSSTPTVVLTGFYTDTYLVSSGTTGFQMRTETAAGVLIAADFTFIAIGPN